MFTTEQTLPSKKIYYTISEVTDLLDIPESTIRYWEKEFPFTTPPKSEKGTRRYTQKDIQNIQLINYLLKERKLTIGGAKKLLKENKKSIERTHEIVIKLEKIKKEIHDLKRAFETHLNIAEENGMVE